MKRSEWRRFHALRRAADDVALPNVVLRRLGESIEVSWDNETWGSVRPDLAFVEQRGTELVTAAPAAAVLRQALCDAVAALADKYDPVELRSTVERAETGRTRDNDWCWLVHEDTACAIQQSHDPLASRLAEHARKRAQGSYIPHTAETLALRQTRLVSWPEDRSVAPSGLASSERADER